MVFLDIVEYSKKSVAEQIKLKNQFNSLIARALRNVSITDRIILDTGDGAAISFLGDPEDALLTAMKLRDAVLAEQDTPFFVRIGINLGPVRLVQDINKQPNIVGDGINVAQRIMNFAQPNQILVSRSFYDVISCVTDEYGGLFEYQGSRTDKHVREHEIYAVKSGVGQEDAFRASFKHAYGENRLKTPWWKDRHLLLRRIFPATAVLFILLALLVKMTSEPGKPPMDAPRIVTARPQSSPLSSPLPVSAPIPSPLPVSAPAVSPKAAPPAARKPAPAALPKKPPVRERKPSHHHAKKVIPAEKSTLVFRIMPWGEIYVDGRNRGASPPLKSLEIPAGKHQIEVRNTTFPTHSQTVETKPGERVIIRHEF